MNQVVRNEDPVRSSLLLCLFCCGYQIGHRETSGIVHAVLVCALVAEINLSYQIFRGRFISEILAEMDICFSFFAKAAEH